MSTQPQSYYDTLESKVEELDDSIESIKTRFQLITDFKIRSLELIKKSDQRKISWIDDSDLTKDPDFQFIIFMHIIWKSRGSSIRLFLDPHSHIESLISDYNDQFISLIKTIKKVDKKQVIKTYYSICGQLISRFFITSLIQMITLGLLLYLIIVSDSGAFNTGVQISFVCLSSLILIMTVFDDIKRTFDSIDKVSWDPKLLKRDIDGDALFSCLDEFGY